MESLLEVRYDTTDGDDRAEVELPVPGLILGSVSVFLQVPRKKHGLYVCVPWQV